MSGCIGVIIFAIWGNKDKWLPEHANNFFGNSLFIDLIFRMMVVHVRFLINFLHIFNFLGWSFILAVIGAVGLVAASILFLTESNVQQRKLRQLKDSQARFELERSSKA